MSPRVVSPGFTDNSSYNFAYQVGGGFDFALRENFWLNLEFNYANFGTCLHWQGPELCVHDW